MARRVVDVVELLTYDEPNGFAVGLLREGDMVEFRLAAVIVDEAVQPWAVSEDDEWFQLKYTRPEERPCLA